MDYKILNLDYQKNITQLTIKIYKINNSFEN